jgi:hypothetical protein
MTCASGLYTAWHTVLNIILGPSYQALLQPGIVFYDLVLNSYVRFLESQC